MKYPYLNDSNFLQKFYNEHLSEMFAKITIYDWAERPIQEIQTIVTGGNVSISADSIVRRTCNLNTILPAEEFNYDDVSFLFSLNRKLSLEVGFVNFTGQYLDYDKIWFPLGFYIIISCDATKNSGGISLSLQLRDKMCLLNGDVGGVLPSAIEWDKYDTIDKNGMTITTYPTIYQIIVELLNHWGGEQLGKIIIRDLDTKAKMYVKWNGKQDLYITKDDIYTLEPSDDAKVVNPGDDIGFIYTDFIYPEELNTEAGAKITDVLDNIKNKLGNYEYYYDIDGNFIFQEIKNYLNTSQSTDILNNMDQFNYNVDYSLGKSVYSFDNDNLLTSLSNNPQYNMIKNDFCIWGQSKSSSGLSKAVCYHLVIDDKPIVTDTEYKAVLYEDKDGLTKLKMPIYFESLENFPLKGEEGIFYCDEGSQLIYVWDTDKYALSQYRLQTFKATDWRTELYYQSLLEDLYGTSTSYYKAELDNFMPQIYDFEKGEYKSDIKELTYFLDFIDSGAAVSKYSISRIGRRQMVETIDSVNCVFEPEMQDIVFVTKGDQDAIKDCEDRGQSYKELPKEIYDNLSAGGLYNSAFNAVRDKLYTYLSYNSSISLSSLPIYHLEVNTRINVNDKQSGISGDYVIKSLTIPLEISGTMSISANQALERI